MRRSTLHALAAAALAASGLAVALPRHAAAQGAPVSRANGAAAGSLTQLMAPWELEATGVARLSAAERRALEGWLSRYTAALRAGRPGAAGPLRDDELPLGRSAPMDTIRPAPGSRPARPTRQPAERTTRIALSVDRVPNALEVVAVHEGGDLVETEDGSLWETYLPDRFNAAAWRAGQQVVVRGNLLPPQLSGPAYDVVLQNGEARSSVAARYAGRQRVELGAEDAGATGSGPQAP